MISTGENPSKQIVPYILKFAKYFQRYPAGNYSSKLTIEKLEQIVKYVHWKHQNDANVLRRSGVIIVNFEHILHLVLMFLLLTLNCNCQLGSAENI